MELPATSPTELRLRARRLHDAAARLEGSLVMTVHCRADDLTWRGGLAVACRDELHVARSRVTSVAACLRAEAADCLGRATALESAPP